MNAKQKTIAESNKQTLLEAPKLYKEVKQNWHWTDDLAYLTWTTIIPIILISTFIFGGLVGLGLQERIAAASFVMGLKIKEPEKKG